MDNKYAFTLSEVLITLAVVGVVAAITLPSVIQHFKERRTVAQLAKTYSVLSQAWQRMEQEYGTIDTWGLTNSSASNYTSQLIVAERLKSYLKVMKSCEVGKVCYKGGTYSLSGYQITTENYVQDEVAPARFFLSDGSLISIGWWGSGHMDINIKLQPDKKVVYGENLFYFNGYPNRIIPDGSPAISSSQSFSNCKKTKSGQLAGRGCTAWVLYNKNMDYLHCNDLSWNGKKTCK